MMKKSNNIANATFAWDVKEKDLVMIKTQIKTLSLSQLRKVIKGLGWVEMETE